MTFPVADNRHSLPFSETKTMLTRGVLIIIEGNQGLGKTTQTRLLENYLLRNNILSRAFYFPRYDTFFGKMSAAFLRGEFGKVEDISPYFIALIFANDRMCARLEIEKALANKELVICDRWLTSNMAIQASKLQGTQAIQKFIAWVSELEYGVFKLPEPDLTIYLRATPDVSLKHLRSKRVAEHLQGKPDIEEASEDLIRKSFERYEELRQKLPNWQSVDLVDGANEPNRILSVEEVHQKILALVDRHLKYIKE